MSGSTWSLMESSLGPWVGGVVHGAEALPADVSVPLGGGQVGVTEQLLHRSQVGTPVEEVRGEGVAEGVRVGGAGSAVVEDPAGVPGGEATAPAVEEQRRRRLGREA